jgi:hypothetical protein
MFTARYALSLYIRMRFVFKGLIAFGEAYTS